MPALREPRWVWLILLAVPLATLVYYPFLPAQLDAACGTTFRGVDPVHKSHIVLFFLCAAGVVWVAFSLLTRVASRFSQRAARWCWELNGVVLFCMLYVEADTLEGNL